MNTYFLISVNNGSNLYLYLTSHPSAFRGFTKKIDTINVNEVILVPGGYRLIKDDVYLDASQLENFKYASKGSAIDQLSVSALNDMLEEINSKTEEPIVPEVVDIPVATVDEPSNLEPVASSILVNFTSEEPHQGLRQKHFMVHYDNVNTIEGAIDAFKRELASGSFLAVRAFIVQGSNILGMGTEVKNYPVPKGNIVFRCDVAIYSSYTELKSNTKLVDQVHNLLNVKWISPGRYDVTWFLK